MIVLDASAAADLLLRIEPRPPPPGRRGATGVAPPCGLSPERAGEALDGLAGLDLSRRPHTPLLGRIWELRNNLTAYVALAEALGAPLVTTDGPAPGYHAEVELYE